MTIPTLIGLMIVYAVLRRVAFGTQIGSVYRSRPGRREEIRTRHARNRRYRVLRERKDNSDGTQEDAASSSCE